MKKQPFIFGVLMLLMASMVLAIAVTMQDPATNKAVNGTYLLNATTDVAAQNCTWYYGTTAAAATTLIGASTNATDFGTTNLVFNFSWDTTAVTDAVYVINATCFNETNDAANDANATSGTTNNTLDNNNPTVVANSPLAGQTVSGSSTVTFKYTPTDANIVVCSLFVDGASKATSTSETTAVQNSLTSTFSSNKQYDWYVQCNDKANRLGSSATVRSGVDTAGGRKYSTQTTTTGVATATGGTTTIATTTPQNMLQNALDWTKQNPIWTMFIAIVAILGYMQFFGGSSGIKRRR